MNPKPHEPRLEYLARVLHYFMHSSIASEITVFYDDAMCDGACLAQDFLDALGMDEEDLEETDA